jgi:hypothetical protein
MWKRTIVASSTLDILSRFNKVVQGCNRIVVHFLYQLLHLNLGALI